MADSILLYNGHVNINVNTLDILKEPNQQLANAIATGPQDEFFSKLEECNRCLRDEQQLSVTPSWNWRPGTFDKIKQYVATQLMIDKKSNGLSKYISRTSENARYRLSWISRKIEECEELKRMLKREGYQHDVNIEEYLEKLLVFCNTIEESIEKATEATNGKVLFKPYIYVPINERNTTFYIDCYIKPGELNVCQDNTLIQKIPITGIKLMFSCPLRKMMKYLDKPSFSSLSVSYTGINDSPLVNPTSYRTSQETLHPYIAAPYRRESNSTNIEWATTCFSSFTDVIRTAFHQLNFVVLSMELLELASYYNTAHANPYNSLNLTHFGMPKDYSKAYQAVVSRDTDNCAGRLRGKMIDSRTTVYSVKNTTDKSKLINYCNSIECQWSSNCHMYKSYNYELMRLDDEEYRYMIESIVGAMMEQWKIETFETVLYEDFGIYFDDSLPEDHELRDSIVCDYQDAISQLIMRHNLDYFDYILREMNYWGKQEKKLASVNEIEAQLNEEQIKREMLQWATERSL